MNDTNQRDDLGYAQIEAVPIKLPESDRWAIHLSFRDTGFNPYDESHMGGLLTQLRGAQLHLGRLNRDMGDALGVPFQRSGHKWSVAVITGWSRNNRPQWVVDTTLNSANMLPAEMERFVAAYAEAISHAARLNTSPRTTVFDSELAIERVTRWAATLRHPSVQKWDGAAAHTVLMETARNVALEAHSAGILPEVTA